MVILLFKELPLINSNRESGKVSRTIPISSVPSISAESTLRISFFWKHCGVCTIFISGRFILKVDFPSHSINESGESKMGAEPSQFSKTAKQSVIMVSDTNGRAASWMRTISVLCDVVITPFKEESCRLLPPTVTIHSGYFDFTCSIQSEWHTITTSSIWGCLQKVETE